ncbi:MAG: hypothetical protein OXF88_01820, partial [Rhodobacteraceae bacterium]|nr:hypothetical protein [Paracoccaceae bacterium]
GISDVSANIRVVLPVITMTCSVFARDHRHNLVLVGFGRTVIANLNSAPEDAYSVRMKALIDRRCTEFGETFSVPSK